MLPKVFHILLIVGITAAHVIELNPRIEEAAAREIEKETEALSIVEPVILTRPALDYVRIDPIRTPIESEAIVLVRWNLDQALDEKFEINHVNLKDGKPDGTTADFVRVEKTRRALIKLKPNSTVQVDVRNRRKRLRTPNIIFNTGAAESTCRKEFVNIPQYVSESVTTVSYRSSDSKEFFLPGTKTHLSCDGFATKHDVYERKCELLNESKAEWTGQVPTCANHVVITDAEWKKGLSIISEAVPNSPSSQDGNREDLDLISALLFSPSDVKVSSVRSTFDKVPILIRWDFFYTESDVRFEIELIAAEFLPVDWSSATLYLAVNNFHQFVDNLKPKTKYFLRIRAPNNDVWSEIVTFTTEMNEQACELRLPSNGKIHVNGTVPPVNGFYPVGAQVNFHCDEDSVLFGSPDSTCVLDKGLAKWNTDFPECGSKLLFELAQEFQTFREETNKRLDLLEESLV